MTSGRSDHDFAAKAAGILLDGLASAHIAQGVRADDYLIRNDKGGHSIWNPRHDDGDSRRLQIACGMNLVFVDVCNSVFAEYPQKPGYFLAKEATFADHNNDKNAAARDAVFQLAVEIGKGMKQ
jgi:hypothetical protein